MYSLLPIPAARFSCLLFSSLLGAAIAVAGQTDGALYLSAFGQKSLLPEPNACRISIDGESVAVRSASPLRRGRPLLIIVDPGSFSRHQAEAHLRSVVEGIAAHMPAGQPVRLGIAILDGILRDPVVDPAMLRKEASSVISGYMPERIEFTGIGPGRFFDIVTNLIARAQEEHGDLDCLILARNRAPEDEEADYVLAALERRLQSICLRKGSTVYGLMAGPGMWSRLCPATGGELFDAPATPATVVYQIFRNRENGARIGFSVPQTDSSVGRLPMTVECETTSGPAVQVRSVESLWRGIDGESPPDYFRIRQALDWRRRSREAEADDNLTVALRFLESSLREDSSNADTHFQAGRVAASLGDTHGAARFLANAIRFAPADAETVALFASVYEKQGRNQEALRTLQNLRDDGRASGRAIRLACARLLVSLDRPEEARPLYEELHGENPGDDRIQGEYGRILWILGERALAETQYKAALSHNPTNPQALAGLSEAALARHDLDAAAAWAARALEVAPQQADAHFQDGKVRLAARNTTSALKSLRSAWEMAPQRYDILSALVDAEIGADRYEEARQILIRAQAAYPSSPQVYEKLAELETHLGNLGVGAAVLEAGAALSSARQAELFRRAAEIRERRGEHGQAILDYRAMLRAADPAKAEALGKEYERHLAYLAMVLNGRWTTADQQTKSLQDPTQQNQEVRPQPAPAPQTADGRSSRGLIVPGGIGLLARTAGLNPGQLRGPQAAERLFHHILEIMPLRAHWNRDNSLIGNLLSYIREYQALVRFLEKSRIIPAHRPEPVNLVLPLVGPKGELEATKRVLSFFGVNHKIRTPKSGPIQVELRLKEGRRQSERQRLLRNMGINLLDSQIREVRITITDEELFIHDGAAIWIEKMLAKPGLPPNDLLEQLLLDPAAMRLYVTLADCSASARSQIVSTSVSGELPAQAEALQLFAGFLDFKDDQLLFPGNTLAWRRLLVTSEPANSTNLLRALLHRDQGKFLALYSLLSAARKSVQDFLTAAPEKLEELYRIISSSLPRPADQAAGRMWTNASRLMGLADADAQGLYIDIDPRLGTQLLASQNVSSAPGSADPHKLRLEVGQFARLLGTAANQAHRTPFPIAEIFEFLKQVRQVNPALISDRSIQALASDPMAAMVCLDLIWQLAPDAELAVRYLKYCRRLAGLRHDDWNANRTRTSQALFALLGALRRQGSLSLKDGRRLLADLLNRLSEDREAIFAIGAADFLSHQLLPAVARMEEKADPGEILLSALAGPPAVLRVSYGGQVFTADPAANKMQQMKQVMKLQQHTPLDLLLAVYRQCDRLLRNEDDFSAFKTASGAIGLIQGPEFLPDNKKARKSIPAVNIAPLRQAWAEAAETARDPQDRDLQRLASETAEKLHVELGVTLLTCYYAYSSSPENDALMFDPHFVRKHAFYWDVGPGGAEWSTVYIRDDERIGSFIAGSLSGLGYQLARLETVQTVTGYGASGSGTMLPTMLAGMRAVQPLHRSDRAQEYVALMARLGRKALALSILDDAVRSWSAEQVGRWTSPGRRERILHSLADHDLESALQLLSPSELFMLGREYASLQESWNPACPISRRLRSLRPMPGSENAEAFRMEIDQYGPLLRTRAGLNQISLSSLDSYERLAAGMQEALLSERICDLKFRTAELAYSRAIPAPLIEFVSSMTLRDIRPDPGEMGADSWKRVLDRIAYLNAGHVREWLEEMLNEGLLVPLSEEGREREGTP